MGFLSNIKIFFTSSVKALWRKFRSFAENAAEIALKEGAAYILDVAMQAVAELAKTNLSSEKKRSEAFKNIKQYAKDQGLEVKDSVINKVIEDCVITFKTEF